MESKGESLGMVLYLESERNGDGGSASAASGGGGGPATKLGGSDAAAASHLPAGWKVRRSVQASRGSAYLEGSKWRCAHCGTMTSKPSNTCTSCGVVNGH